MRFWDAPAWLIPITQIVPSKGAAPSTEDEMLFCDYNNEERSPVGENTQEIRQNLREVLTATHTGDGVNDERKERPEETRNHSKWAAN